MTLARGKEAAAGVEKNMPLALGKIGEGIAKRGRIFAKNRRQGRLSAADDGFGVGEVRSFLLKIQRKGVSLQIN